MNRRDFLRGTSGALAVSALLPASAWGDGQRRALVAGHAPMRLAAGRFAVLEPERGVLTLHAADGRPQWRRAGLGRPRAVAEHGDRVYVSDALGGCVHVLSASGASIDVWGGFGQPWGLVARPDGLYVADRFAQRLRVRAWSGAERLHGVALSGPTGLIADGPGLWVADAGNARVIRLDESGRLLAERTADGLWRPRALALDRHGRLHVAGLVPPEVLTFGADGRLRRRWRPSTPPRGLAVEGPQLIVGLS